MEEGDEVGTVWHETKWTNPLIRAERGKEETLEAPPLLQASSNSIDYTSAAMQLMHSKA